MSFRCLSTSDASFHAFSGAWSFLQLMYMYVLVGNVPSLIIVKARVPLHDLSWRRESALTCDL
eukprot:scaffold303267_cov31-Tisochrysis_lutea.AAC.4